MTRTWRESFFEIRKVIHDQNLRVVFCIESSEDVCCFFASLLPRVSLSCGPEDAGGKGLS